MGRTRFMVVKAKELIKTAVFAVLGVIILVGLIAFFLNMGQHDGAYRDGTYYEEIQLGEETAEVAVTIAEGRIAAVSMEEETEAVAVHIRDLTLECVESPVHMRDARSI